MVTGEAYIQETLQVCAYDKWKATSPRYICRKRKTLILITIFSLLFSSSAALKIIETNINWFAKSFKRLGSILGLVLEISVAQAGYAEPLPGHAQLIT